MFNQRDYQREYATSERGKARCQRYVHSEKGKTTRSEYWHNVRAAFRATPEGRAKHAEYQRTYRANRRVRGLPAV